MVLRNMGVMMKGKSNQNTIPVFEVRNRFELEDKLSELEDQPSVFAIVISDSVKKIGDWDFSDCSGLSSIFIPDSVKKIGCGAFQNCTGLTSIRVSKGNPVYDSRNDCNAIIETDSNTLITGCENTVIPDSVEEIGEGAFQDCLGLTRIDIPDSVTEIGYQAFSGCANLTRITVGKGNPVYDSRNDCNAIIETDTNMLIAGCENTVIPDSVTEIGINAFCKCVSMTDITIPDSVTQISEYSFSGCTGLTRIIIPDSVTAICSFAFGDCTGLRSVVLPAYVTYIGHFAFSGCTGLSRIVIPDTLTEIHNDAFPEGAEIIFQ